MLFLQAQKCEKYDPENKKECRGECQSDGKDHCAVAVDDHVAAFPAKIPDLFHVIIVIKVFDYYEFDRINTIESLISHAVDRKSGIGVFKRRYLLIGSYAFSEK